jgi:hypothetical protein
MHCAAAVQGGKGAIGDREEKKRKRKRKRG